MADYRRGSTARVSMNPIRPDHDPKFVREMRVYKGKIVTLSRNPDQIGNCRIREDNEEFSWNTRWFEDPEEQQRQAEREKEKQRRQEQEEEQRKQKEQEEQACRQEADRKKEEEKDRKKEAPPVEIKISDTIRTDGILFQKEPAKTLLIACSDGRFHQAVEFLCVDHLFPHENGIDVYCVPGGVGQFNMFRSSLYVDYESHLEDAKMLVLEHGIKTAVLIAHEHCLFYKKKLPEANATQIFNEQVRDLKSAAAKLREINKEIKIVLAYAQVDENSGEIFFQMIDS